MTYLLSSTIDEALSCLASGETKIIAGATDFYPALGAKRRPENVLDVSRVEELRGISFENDQWTIGAAATWSDLAGASLPPAFAGLQAAATKVGGVQIQNVATVLGNVCNASPAADGVPPLLTLDASVEIRSSTSTRVVGLSDFILGNRRTALEPNEMATALLIPEPSGSVIGSFEKLGSRAYLVISIVMVSALAEVEADGTINEARVAVGACSEIATRLWGLETDLVGENINELTKDFITPAHLSGLSPIDDVRATAGYRLSVTPELIVRSLINCQGAKS